MKFVGSSYFMWELCILDTAFLVNNKDLAKKKFSSLGYLTFVNINILDKFDIAQMSSFKLYDIA